MKTVEEQVKAILKTVKAKEKELEDLYYCDRPQYAEYGLGVKEAYEEFVSSMKYDE